MSTQNNYIRQIRQIIFEAYQTSGQTAALLAAQDTDPRTLARSLEQTASCVECAAVELRSLCERCMPMAPDLGKKPELPALDVAGQVEINEFGWLHIRLNTLLPHCRFASPLWLTDTISRLLDRQERRQGKLPLLKRALLVIEEQCDIDSRQVFDQDNKGYKAVSNALKGRVVSDDDQFSLGVCLLSRRGPEAACHIYVLPVENAGDFFFMRAY
ncbi:MAG: hypothetical protein HFF18_06520 [Oscillospiraceae bacterium]|nr:hypothetical protein [Oscillospiraceae bacterium]